MKRILDVVSYPYLPYFSGGQKSVAQFFEFLGQQADLTVVGTSKNDFRLARNYKTQPLLGRSFLRYLDVRLVWKISSLIKKGQFDIILWEHPYYAWLAWIIKKKTGIKTAFHTHNIEHERFRSLGKWWWRIFKWYERWSFRFADHIFFITEEEREKIVGMWGVDPAKTMEVTFGIESDVTPADRDQCRNIISVKHGIPASDQILLFNGLLSYGPNLDALHIILNDINPYLLSAPGFRYKIIICGKGLPENLNKLQSYHSKNVIYAGFVEDIETYFKGASLFLNPVQSGGGIKTKMVEAIGCGTTVISTETGAAGIHRNVCGPKLTVVPDDDWKGFATAVINSRSQGEPTPAVYYQQYYWGNITKKVLTVID